MELFKKYAIIALTVFWILFLGYGCVIYWQERSLNAIQDRLLLVEIKKLNTWLTDTANWRPTWMSALYSVQQNQQELLNRQHLLEDRQKEVLADLLKFHEEYNRGHNRTHNNEK